MLIRYRSRRSISIHLPKHKLLKQSFADRQFREAAAIHDPATIHDEDTVALLQASRSGAPRRRG